MSTSKTPTRRFVRKIRKKLFSLQGSTSYIAKGFALGSFIGMMPVPGFQVFIALGLASWFKINKTAACMAVFNTNVVTALPIFYFNYWLGKLLLGLKLDFVFPETIGWDFAMIIWHAGKMVFLSLVVGGVLTGILAAILGYYGYLWWAYWRKPKLGKNYQYAADPVGSTEK